MTRLAPDAYLSAIRSESALFRTALAGCDPDARVPACPDWSAADLLWHLATVQRWWAEVVRARPERPEEVEPQRPESYVELLTTFDAWSTDLAVALEAADPRDEAWNWSEDHTVGFILRRQRTRRSSTGWTPSRRPG
ncbi:maleylpyruvate isomerase N-terminal domain-containing protein [Nocardioides zeicaulis]|uniref:Maleylpyruvate isomerase N-terminal domain-containing protein n=1 Tax=Nocardioides zeicaulis TaxID=1776857 RepID=A0ABV6DVT9_9ACTN